MAISNYYFDIVGTDHMIRIIAISLLTVNFLFGCTSLKKSYTLTEQQIAQQKLIVARNVQSKSISDITREEADARYKVKQKTHFFCLMASLKRSSKAEYTRFKLVDLAVNACMEEWDDYIDAYIEWRFFGKTEGYKATADPEARSTYRESTEQTLEMIVAELKKRNK